MTLSRRPVLRDHVLPLIALSVRPDQADLVSNNAKSLAEAAYEPASQIWGLWDDDTPVGLMAMINPDGYDWAGWPLPEPVPGQKAAYLWRLMIGRGFQGKSYGGAALALAVQQTRDWGYTCLTAHVTDVAHSNLGFYQRYGFRDTGVVEDGERVIVLTL